MNKTTNYQLNQWERTDKVQMEDFNADNAKIDAAVKAVDRRVDGKADASALSALTQTVAGKGNCQIAYGSYTGTGQYGPDHPTTLTFPFPPKIVVIAQELSGRAGDFSIAVRGQTRFSSCGSSGGGDYCVPTWNGNKLTWYSEYSASSQMNWTYTYFYVALG